MRGYEPRIPLRYFQIDPAASRHGKQFLRFRDENKNFEVFSRNCPTTRRDKFLELAHKAS